MPRLHRAFLEIAAGSPPNLIASGAALQTVDRDPRRGPPMTATLQLSYDADRDRLHGTLLGADTSAAQRLRAGADPTVGADDTGGVVEFAIENFADYLPTPVASTARRATVPPTDTPRRYLVRKTHALVATGTATVLTMSACSGGGEEQGSGADPAGDPQSGGVLTLGLYQEPDNLNPYLAVQTASRLVRELTIEGLGDAGPADEYVPALAAEVPSEENGGISPDGRTITYQLQDGLEWSDGHPLTSADVKFTWDTIMAPGNAVNSRTGYDLIESIETPDDTTVVVQFSEVYAPALSLFSIAAGILPQHVLEGESLADADYNRAPEGTGPFVVTEWTSGDSIVLDRNPNYREEGRPYLDQIVVRLIPSREVGIARLRAGEIDVLWDLIETQIPEFEQLPDVTLQSTPTTNVEYLGLNTDNPVLADVNVRQAIAAAIDRTPIVEDLLYGETEVATSPIGMGWAAPEGLELPPYDPEAAMGLLEDAGWTDEDGDGVRDKDGQPLELRITTPTGSQTRELTQQLLQEQLGEVGIRLTIENAPAASIFGNWEENGLLKRGDFDIVEDTWGADFDPADFLATLFTSDQIPTAENGGEGWNFFRLADPELDAAIAEGSSTLNQEERAAAYRTAVERIAESSVYIPLYRRSELDAFSAAVQGYEVNSWDEFTWNAKDWWLNR